jgi:hypothetical protein
MDPLSTGRQVTEEIDEFQAGNLLAKGILSSSTFGCEGGFFIFSRCASLKT